MSEGWVSLHRELFDKPIWLNSSPEHKVILITLLLMANHAPRQWEWGGEKCMVERGQTITSAASVMKVCGHGISRQNVRGALLRFEKLGFLTNESTKTGCKITICNYSRYQDANGKINQGANQEVTKHQPRGNQEVTTNNKDNKDNKKKTTVPPAVKVYHSELNRYPNKCLWPGISKVVGTEEVSLKFWRKVIVSWVACGRNPTNLKGMLEHFNDKMVPTTKPKQSAGPATRGRGVKL